jgi:hypothetical protein
MGQALRHLDRAVATVQSQQQFGDRVDRPPHPVGRTGQPLDGFPFVHLACLDHTDYGVEVVQLHLRDAYVVQEIPRKGSEMIGRFH